MELVSESRIQFFRRVQGLTTFCLFLADFSLVNMTDGGDDLIDLTRNVRIIHLQNLASTKVGVFKDFSQRRLQEYQDRDASFFDLFFAKTDDLLTSVACCS